MSKWQAKLQHNELQSWLHFAVDEGWVSTEQEGIAAVFDLDDQGKVIVPQGAMGHIDISEWAPVPVWGGSIVGVGDVAQAMKQEAHHRSDAEGGWALNAPQDQDQDESGKCLLYDLPVGASTIYHVVRDSSHMAPNVGEAFRMVYSYATEGHYHLGFDVGEGDDINTLMTHHNFNGFVYDTLQALYRSGRGERNTRVRDLRKALYYVGCENDRIGGDSVLVAVIKLIQTELKQHG